jgi:uncharacterized membrane protein
VEPAIRETLDVVFRWVHLIAGIMWVGNSLLFNWLDRNLVRREGAPERHVGEVWLLHSGGFYEVEKKFLGPTEMPKVLHWFKWQAYTTWLTGACLLAIVYYSSGGDTMLDPSVSRIGPGAAVALGAGSIIGGWMLYELLWRSPLARFDAVATALSLAVLSADVWLVTHLLSGRAAFIHVGAMLGTCMAGNVFFHIVPSQRALVASTLAGRPRAEDERLSNLAKRRSIHNNYMTFPLLFTMVSNHFGGVYGNPYNWALLAVVFVGGASARHVLNVRFSFGRWVPALAATISVTVGLLLLMLARAGRAADVAALNGPRVSFAAARAVLSERCVPCHSANPTIVSSPLPPPSVRFDTAEEIRQFASRIETRAVVSRSMPLANKTQITDEERDLLGRWFAEGAPTE